MKHVVTCRIEKVGMLRYISHLDLLRLLQRAIRRAGIPLAFSQGHNPHMRVKIEPAVKLGVESRDLKGTMELSERMPLADIMGRLRRQLPAGITVTDIKIGF